MPFQNRQAFINLRLNPEVMKYAHHIELSVFAHEGEDKEKIKQTLKSLVHIDFEEEKLKVDEKTATSFQEKKIKIYKILLEKEKHTKVFLEALLSKLTKEQKEMLLIQKESRLDEDLCFFIRLEKDQLMQGKTEITDSGNCFHIKIHIAAFPAKRENAMQVIDKLLNA